MRQWNHFANHCETSFCFGKHYLPTNKTLRNAFNVTLEQRFNFLLVNAKMSFHNQINIEIEIQKFENFDYYSKKITISQNKKLVRIVFHVFS